MNKVRLTFACFVVFIFASIVLGDLILPINPRFQQTFVWCWLATSEMVLRHLNVGSVNPVSYQCGLVAAFGGPFSSCWSNCGNCMVPAGQFGGAEVITKLLTGYPEVARAFGAYDGRRVSVQYKYAALTSQEIQQNIDARQPIIAGISPSGFPTSVQSEHVAVIVGYQIRFGRTYLIVNDPFPFPPSQDPYVKAGGVARISGQYEIDRDSFAYYLVWRESWHNIRPGTTTHGTYHVFPQFADGRATDGTFYRSTILISNPASSSPSCTLRLYGIAVNGQSSFTYNLGPSGWWIDTTPGTQDLRSGYSTLQCTTPVEASVLYSFYSPSGQKLGEATVFPSPSGTNVHVVSDQRDNAVLGLGIANDSDQSGNFTLSALNNAGQVVATRALSLAPRSSQAFYLHQMLTVPTNFFGLVTIQSSSGSASMIGLRYTGSTFTTIPETPRSPAGKTSDAYHVFPQYADGVLVDGTFYRSSIMISNPSTVTSTSCTLRLYGLSVSGRTTWTYSLGPGGSVIDVSPGVQPFRSGYATLQCTNPVESSLLYSFYEASGLKISEATVFSAPSGFVVQVLGDLRGGSRLGLSIANDSDQFDSFRLTAFNVQGQPVASANFGLGPRSVRSAFLDEMLTVGPDYIGQVIVESHSGFASVIGLRYTGPVFTTIPETWRQ